MKLKTNSKRLLNRFQSSINIIWSIITWKHPASRKPPRVFIMNNAVYKKELDPQFNLTHSEFKKNPIVTPVIDLKPLAIEF